MNLKGALFRLGILLALSTALASCGQALESEAVGIESVTTQSSTLPSTLVTSAALTPAPSATPEPVEQREELPSVSLVVTNGTVIDGTGAAPVTDGLVAIDGNLIVAVGQAADFKIPDDVMVIDARGGTILPGIFNAHVHNGNAVGTRRTLFLLDGVTSVCDLGIPLFAMKGFEDEGFKAGPAARGFKAGSVITAPGGYPGVQMGSAMNYEIQGEEEAAAAVQDLYERGVDYIKVVLEPGYYGENLPVITVEELRAVVAAAHADDLLVRTHVTKSAMLDLALEAGVDVIEHAPVGSEPVEEMESLLDENGAVTLPTDVEAQMLRMIDQGIALVPTLEVYLEDPYLLRALDPETDILHHPVFQVILEIVRFFHDSGGFIALGNDYGNPGVKSGMPLREMELLQAVGLTPHEVIVAATQHAAYVCGHEDELGTLEAGKLADLIVVDGDPLEHLDTMDKLLYVVKNGEVALSPQEDAP